MLNIFICEDEKKHMDIIKKHIDDYVMIHELPMEIVCAANNPGKIISHLKNNPGEAGIYFLDLHLNADMNGIDLGTEIRKIDPRGFIVYITSDGESYRMTFKHKIEAMDYIVKGDAYLAERIGECLYSAHIKLTTKTSVLQDNFVFKLSDDVRKFRGKSDLAKDSIISIENEKILYFMTEPELKHTVIVVTTDGQMQFRGSLSDIEKKVDAKRFYRCQKNLIVNLNKIAAVDSMQYIIRFIDDSEVYLVPRNAKKLKERISEQNVILKDS